MAKSLPHNLIEIRRDWAELSGYERFEALRRAHPYTPHRRGHCRCPVAPHVRCGRYPGAPKSTRWSTACFKQSSGRS
jgi:hypothetical protein